jgi:sugar phosphate isomerase/epimerase
MNELIFFTKLFKDYDVPGLTSLAHRFGLDGLDLCVRPGYPISPENAPATLPQAARDLAAEGLCIPMVTGSIDLLWPDDPTAEPLLKAMDQADIRLLKLGYHFWDPFKQDYWSEVDRIRRGLEIWQSLAALYGVKICLHTHSLRCMGMNASGLMHLIQGFNPQWIGAFIDPVHFVIEGEEFAVGANMTQAYLSIASIKDVLLRRIEVDGHSAIDYSVVSCGTGMVDFDNMFRALARFHFQGPLTIHCEFEQAHGDEFLRLAEGEARFGLDVRARYLPTGSVGKSSKTGRSTK